MAWSWQGAIASNAATTVSAQGVRLATLVPIAPTFVRAPCEVAAERRYVLSRFAYIHREDGALLLDSPLAHARIVLHDWRATALVHLLTEARSVGEVCAQMPQVGEETARALVAVLLAARMAALATAAGDCAADEAVALRSWEFHDLLFHARSRPGRHDRPVGATHRFLGELEPPPPLPVSSATPPPLELYRPDLQQLEQTDPPFARVQEARRSIRSYGERPLTARQLGEFLYRVGRVADFWQAELHTAGKRVRVAAAVRPYPAGGGLYELDLYVLVNRCDGVEPGLYCHDAERHALRRQSAEPADLDALLTDASIATMVPRERLQVLIVVTARFQRIAWKYASIAYSLILKDVGVLYDTMYLAATAMGLAPCAAGCGNADLFARAAGLDYYAQTSVGEFLVGSRD